MDNLIENFENFKESKKHDRDVTDAKRGDIIKLVNGEHVEILYKITNTRYAVKNSDGKEGVVSLNSFDSILTENNKINEYWDYTQKNNRATVSAKINTALGTLKTVEVQVKINYTGDDSKLLKTITNSILKSI